MSKVQKCTNNECNKVANWACGSCISVYYCGLTCQRANWSQEHRYQCKYLSQESSSILERRRRRQVVTIERDDTIRKDLTLIEPLGSGTFGGVWAGVRSLGNGKEVEPVIVKISDLLILDENQKIDVQFSSEALASFVAEVSAQKIIQTFGKQEQLCENVVACKSEDDEDVIVTPDLRGVLIFPYKTPKTLQKFISEQFERKIEPKQRQKEVERVKKILQTDDQTKIQSYISKENLVISLDIAEDLVRDVATLHKFGMSHLDLKPGNVIVAETNLPRSSVIIDRKTILIDFGFACANYENADSSQSKNFKNVFEEQRSLIAKKILEAPIPGNDEQVSKRKRDGDSSKSSQRTIGGLKIPFETVKKTMSNIAKRLTIEAVLSCRVNRGTPIYFNRNLVNASGFDNARREDIFSLGVILFELFRGRLLENDPDFEKFVNDENGGEELGASQPYIMKQLQDKKNVGLIQKMINSDSNNGFSDANDVLQSIQDILITERKELRELEGSTRRRARQLSPRK